MVSFEDFDRYVEERGIADEDLPQAFAQWLAAISGETIIGERVSGEGPPTVTGKPPEDDEP